jgi:hypothetical protein
MITRRLSIAIAVAISISIGSGMVRPDLRTFAAAPTSVTKVDFDRVFADVTPQGIGYVDRARKGDRLSRVKSASPAALPYCEPVASPYADPILGRIIGRCAA